MTARYAFVLLAHVLLRSQPFKVDSPVVRFVVVDVMNRVCAFGSLAPAHGNHSVKKSLATDIDVSVRSCANLNRQAFAQDVSVGRNKVKAVKTPVLNASPIELFQEASYLQGLG